MGNIYLNHGYMQASRGKNKPAAFDPEKQAEIVVDSVKNRVINKVIEDYFNNINGGNGDWGSGSEVATNMSNKFIKLGIPTAIATALSTAVNGAAAIVGGSTFAPAFPVLFPLLATSIAGPKIDTDSVAHVLQDGEILTDISSIDKSPIRGGLIMRGLEKLIESDKKFEKQKNEVGYWMDAIVNTLPEEDAKVVLAAKNKSGELLGGGALSEKFNKYVNSHFKQEFDSMNGLGPQGPKNPKDQEKWIRSVAEATMKQLQDDFLKEELEHERQRDITHFNQTDPGVIRSNKAAENQKHWGDESRETIDNDISAETLKKDLASKNKLSEKNTYKEVTDNDFVDAEKRVERQSHIDKASTPGAGTTAMDLPVGDTPYKSKFPESEFREASDPSIMSQTGRDKMLADERRRLEGLVHEYKAAKNNPEIFQRLKNKNNVSLSQMMKVNPAIRKSISEMSDEELIKFISDWKRAK